MGVCGPRPTFFAPAGVVAIVAASYPETRTVSVGAVRSTTNDL